MRFAALSVLTACAHHFEPPYVPVERPTDVGREFLPDELRADVAAFVALLEAVHPDPFSVLPEAEFHARRVALDATLDHPMDRLEFYRALAPLVAALGDGHTGLSYRSPELDRIADDSVIGASIGVRDGQLTYQGSLATGNDVPPVGTPIVAIDGHSAADIYRDFVALQSGERLAFREDNAENEFPHLWWMTHGTTSTTTLTFGPNGDTPRSLVVQGLASATRKGFGNGRLGCGFAESGDRLDLPGDPWPERRAVVIDAVLPGSGCELAGVVTGQRVLGIGGVPVVTRADVSRALVTLAVGAAVEIELSGANGPERRTVVAAEVPQRTAWSRRPSPDGVQVVELRSMEDPRGFGRFLDETFEVMEREGRRDLIVDLRDNGGGNSALIDTFCERISPTEWMVYSRVETTSTPTTWAYWDHYIRNDVPWPTRFVHRAAILHPLRTKAVDGLQVVDGKVGGRVPRSPFAGRVVVLTSRFTFSSAADLAAVMKDFGLATLVGEETGGLASSFGELYQTNLPNTRLTLGLSQKRFVRPSGVVDDRGVLPDVEVTADEALEAALAWLSEPANH